MRRRRVRLRREQHGGAREASKQRGDARRALAVQVLKDLVEDEKVARDAPAGQREVGVRERERDGRAPPLAAAQLPERTPRRRPARTARG